MLFRQFLLLMFIALLLGGLSTGGATFAQTENSDFPPIVFITATEILKWTGGDQIEFVAEMPQPTYEVISNRNPLVWHDLVVSPDLQYVAYMVNTSEWQTLVGNNATRDGDSSGDNIFVVDVATGQTKPIALQETAEPRSQISRRNLQWTPDSQSLLWMEDTDAGNVIRFDLSTNALTTLVETNAPDFPRLSIPGENRLILSDTNDDNRTSNYTIYDMDGTLISHIDSLESTEAPIYHYLIPEGESLFYGTDLERINLEDGEVSAMPAGRLLEVSANAPETSLQIAPVTFDSEGCMSDIFTADGEFFARIPIGGPTDMSPDGSAILYRDPYTQAYVILQIDESGDFHQVDLPPITDVAVYLVAWGVKTFIFEAGGDSFNGRFGCAAG